MDRSPGPRVRSSSLGVILAAALHALDGEAGVLRRGHEPEEPGAARPLRARVRSCCVPLVVLWRSSWAWRAPSSRARIEPTGRRPSSGSVRSGLAGPRGAPVRASRHLRRGGAADERVLDLRPLLPAAIVALTGLVVLLAQAFTPRAGVARRRPRPGRPRRRPRLASWLLAPDPGAAPGWAAPSSPTTSRSSSTASILGVAAVTVLCLAGLPARERRSSAASTTPCSSSRPSGMLGLVSCARAHLALRGPRDHVGRSLRAGGHATATGSESQESALKYFVTGAFSSAFLLYGIALLYGATGSTSLDAIARAVSVLAPGSPPLALLGVGLLLVGFGFKVARVPVPHVGARRLRGGAHHA